MSVIDGRRVMLGMPCTEQIGSAFLEHADYVYKLYW